MSSFVVGLTGGIGSGKSTVAAYFRQHGVVTVDADDVAREVVEPGSPALEAIARHFGPQVIQENGSLDRAALRAIVFATEEKRQWLEQLLHPLIRQRTEQQLQAATSPYVILVSPLLLETDQQQLVDRILVIDVSTDTQLNRTMSRDNNNREQVERIMAAQMPREARRAQADDIIDNEVTPDALARAVEQLHQRYLELATLGAGTT
ncbi:dephospho-CoA kinase [Mangrovitalea sediminis]|uniref:dephospho-CoA kinase n=1 Tax=Mangrovitalea sediminis TaxID=1982043 RepID=UPI000BE5AEE1|nr:dephospho-CoA kinase [Mangrovitalea sediminis]